MKKALLYMIVCLATLVSCVDTDERPDTPVGNFESLWRIIDENKIKENPDYSCYNFRNKRQEEEYEQSGKVANGTPSIYKTTAIDYIIQIFNNEH